MGFVVPFFGAGCRLTTLLTSFYSHLQRVAFETQAFIFYKLLNWRLNNVTNFDQLERLLAHLSPSVKASYWAQKTIAKIHNVQNRPRVGKKLPAFSLLDATGKTITLTSFAGKYVLLDFWGT